MKIQSFLLGTALAAVCLLPACYAEVTPDAAYVDAPAPAVDVSTYPQSQYQGQTVYLVNDHWYTRHGDKWAYYRTEPEELRRRRTTVQAAPPARENERPLDAPHARRVD
jgi:hypothetical protein